MKYTLHLILVLFSLSTNAQESYTELTEKAIKTVNFKDSIHYKSALSLFDQAFKEYPDSINGTGLYYASTLAADLKDLDKSFEYLTPLAEMETDENGYPGWSFVLDKYAQKDYKNLLNDKRWKKHQKCTQVGHL